MSQNDFVNVYWGSKVSSYYYRFNEYENCKVLSLTAAAAENCQVKLTDNNNIYDRQFS